MHTVHYLIVLLYLDLLLYTCWEFKTLHGNMYYFLCCKVPVLS